MSLLTTADLAYMQATQETALPGTVVIERYTTSSDGMGGQVQTWAAAGTVDGRIYPRSRLGIGEMAGGGQILSVTDWFATLPFGTDVIASDRLVYADRTWEVIRVNNDESYMTAVRCEVRALNEERRT
jgi:head-tail adaptor